MPKLVEPHNYTCIHCGSHANFISINTKQHRCVEIITRCPGVIAKANITRKANPNLQKLMVEKNKKAHQRLRLLEKDPAWILKKKTNISNSIKANGGHHGQNNPGFGTKRTEVSKSRMRSAATTRDNTNIGKYERTEYHRDILSQHIIIRAQTGKMKRMRDTKPELLAMDVLIDHGILFEKQFLIQYGRLGGKLPWFRHAYDLKIVHTNVLIEIDGDYWHSLPATKERDRVCEQEATQRGFVVVRVTETEIKTNPVVLIERISKYVPLT